MITPNRKETGGCGIFSEIYMISNSTLTLTLTTTGAHRESSGKEDANYTLAKVVVQ